MNGDTRVERYREINASSQTGVATVRALLATDADTHLTGIYRDLSKASPDFATDPRFTAVKDGISPDLTLDFSSTDALSYFPPPLPRPKHPP
ncbi:hypothetical protein BDZ85DRAFT_279324 [Elsinoe ampelina]|uniref:Uncharacterized protein n=1 Tax=Elsinoe ampelina TaxID=302913 RepID=A0A6A6GIS9_9PEZI|nr:hypothetical protein BDZ85DRAFT_279324 [Elsinoe ampelina]